MKKSLKLHSILFLIGGIIALSLRPLQASQPKATNSSKLTPVELEYLEELDVLDPTHNNVDGEIISVSKTRVSEKNIYDYEPRGPIGANYMTMYLTVTRMNAQAMTNFSFIHILNGTEHLSLVELMELH